MIVSPTHHHPLQIQTEEKLRRYHREAARARSAAAALEPSGTRERRAPMMHRQRNTLWPALAIFVLLAACQVVPEPTGPTTLDPDIREITLGGETISYEVVDGLAIFEGDILLGTVEELEQRTLTPQSIYRDRYCNWFWCDTTDYRWPDGVVPFFIDGGVTTTGTNQIERAIEHWEDNTPIRFIELGADPDRSLPGTDYVRFVRGSSRRACSSAVGRQGGRQTIRLTSNGTCSWGTLVHEIGHALGLWHEQSRSDRNDYVTIVWDNIADGREGNFSKQTRDGRDLGRYDIESVMHYRPFDFCRRNDSGSCVGPTITRLDGSTDWSPSGLSAGDIAAIDALYGAEGEQRDPVVASDSNGNFVVVWEDDSDENGQFQIYAQGFDGSGRPRFAPVTVNTVSWRQQVEPAVAMNDDGSFVVVWQDNRYRSSGYDIYARGFHPDGRVRFGERIVNADRSGRQSRPDVAMDARGRFVVTWQDDRDGNGYYNILARYFHADGRLRLGTITVNSDRSGQQLRPAVAMDDDGRFVVVWQDDRDGNDYYNILARGFYASGRERFRDITVNSDRSGQQLRPDIAMNATGDFVVVWQDDGNRNGKYEILARGFHPDGRERLGDFTVNRDSDGNQARPAIAMNAHGNFVVAWQDDRDGNGKYEILARGFYASGRERFRDITVNSIAHGQQKVPAIASGPVGSFVVAWRDEKPVNDVPDVMARRFRKDGTPRFLDITVR